jgi:hypothetical protein
MDKITDPQLELFSEGQNSYLPTKPRGFSFLTYVRGYEKVILLIITFTITGIISFSLGVEKGKSLAMKRLPEEEVYHKQATAVAQPRVIPPEQVQKEPESAPKQNTPDGYTVQLASYQSKVSAQKEAELLKKMGHSPLILSKGKYMVLCVGNFPSQQEAKSLLSQFEKGKRYKGCYVRRL